MRRMGAKFSISRKQVLTSSLSRLGFGSDKVHIKIISSEIMMATKVNGSRFK